MILPRGVSPQTRYARGVAKLRWVSATRLRGAPKATVFLVCGIGDRLAFQTLKTVTGSVIYRYNSWDRWRDPWAKDLIMPRKHEGV